MNPADEGLFKSLITKLTADSLRYLPATIVPAGVGIAGVFIFTRLFDTLDYGRYALVIATTTIVILLLSSWIQQSTLRYLPRCETDRDVGEFVMKLFVMLSLVLGCFMALAVAAYFILPDQFYWFRQFYVPAVVLVVTESLFLCFLSVYQSRRKSTIFARCKIAVAVLRLGLALGFIFFIKKEVVGIVVGAAAAHLLVSAVVMWNLSIWKRLSSAVRVLDVKMLKTFAGYGLPMIGWILCGQILDICDRYLIGWFRDSSEVGVYSANYNLVRMGFQLISGPFLTASYPIIMSAWEKGNRDKITDIITEFSRYYLLILLPVALVIGVFSREIVSIVLGEQFRAGYTIVPYVLAGMLLWGLSMIGHKGLEILENTRLMLFMVIAAAGTNVVLNLFLIPRYGYHGAAVATMISYLVYPLLVYVFSVRRIAWRLDGKSLIRAIVAVTVMAAAVLGMKTVLPESLHPLLVIAVSGLTGLAVYIGCLFLFRELRLRGS